MKPLHLYIENFACYDKSHLDFTSFTSALIVGILNNNARFSNGVGKSSIFYAIEYALYNQYPAKKIEKIIRTDCKSARIIFDFQIDNITYRIVRKRTASASDVSFFSLPNPPPLTNLETDKWTDLTCRRSSDTEKEIKKVIKMTPDTFQSTIHFIQGDISGLATATPTARKQFLKSALDLSIYAKVEKFAKEYYSKFYKAIDVKKGVISATGNPANEIPVLTESLTSIQSNIETTISNVTELQNQIPPLDEQKQSLSNDIAQYTTAHSAIVAKKTSIERDIQSFEKTIASNKSSLTALKDEATKAIEDIKASKASLKSLEESIEDTSEIEATLPALKEQETHLSSSIYANTIAIKDASKAIISSSATQEALDQIILLPQPQLDALQSEIDTLSKTVPEFSSVILANTSKVKELSSPLPEDDVCSNCKQAITEEHREQHTKEVQERIQALNAETAVSQSNLTAAKQTIANNQRTIKEQAAMTIKAKQIASDIALIAKVSTLTSENQTLNASLSVIKAEIKDKQAAIDAQRKLLQTIKSLTSDIQHKETLISTKREIFKNTQAQIKQAEALVLEKSSSLSDTEIELSNLDQESVNQWKDALNTLTLQVKELQSQIKAGNQSLSELKSKSAIVNHQIQQKQSDIAKLAALTSELSILESKALIYPEVVQAFSSIGIPNLIIQSVLSDLQNETNEFLNMVKPGFQAQFVVEKESKDEVQDTLEIVYFINGNERVFEQLSGAQKLLASFSLKLGLSQLLQKMMGIRIEFLLLDECDAALDENSIDLYADIIKQLEKRYTILVITHNAQLKEHFEHHIIVEQDHSLVSRIR
jgi:DNA repair exonuclease SbcCD ATPase subunit